MRVFGRGNVGDKELVRLLGTTLRQMSESRFEILTPTEEATIHQPTSDFLYCYQFGRTRIPVSTTRFIDHRTKAKLCPFDH